MAEVCVPILPHSAASRRCDDVALSNACGLIAQQLSSVGGFLDILCTAGAGGRRSVRSAAEPEVT